MCLTNSESQQTQTMQFEIEKVLFRGCARRQFAYAPTPQTGTPQRVSAKWSCMDVAAAATAKSLQSCPTLWDPIDGSPLGSSVSGILQARTLEWVAISFSNAWKWKVKVKSLSRAQLLVTSWTAAHQAPLSMGFSGQENWSGVPLPSPFLIG